MPPRLGLSKDITADPAARVLLSQRLSGTLASYLGGGRFSTENALADRKAVTRRRGGRAKKHFEAIVGCCLLANGRRKVAFVSTS